MLRSNDPCGGGTGTVYRTGSTIQGNSDKPSYFKLCGRKVLGYSVELNDSLSLGTLMTTKTLLF